MRYHEQTFPSVKHLEPQRIGGSYGKREAVMVGESGQAKGSDGIQLDQRVLKTHKTEARERHLLGKDIKKVA